MSEAAGASPVVVLTFLLFLGVTLAITWWAARHTKSTRDFYAAGGRITGFQNGLAIAGDFMSAATFLGITGLTYLAGLDATIYVLAPMVGFCLLLMLMVEPFRRLGRFTVSDVAAHRFETKSVRVFAAVTSLIIVLLYLVSQMVGAGALVQLLFGIPYGRAVVVIGALMVFYVSVGGMMATTWVQIIKAVLMVFGVTVLAGATLASFGFDFSRLYREASGVHRLGAGIFAPGGLLEDPWSTISLSLALVFGFVGLPHIVMRLYTVPDEKAAYQSVLFASVLIGFVFVLVFFILGYGAIPRLHEHPELFGPSGALIGGSNMVAVHLARVVAGDIFVGFIGAVVFATILAVVAGLTLAGASALSHDLFATAWRGGRASEAEELRVTRYATLALGLVAIVLAIFFEGQNIVYMASMVFAISASANFPLLILSVYWRGLTSAGAIAGCSVGLTLSIALMVLGPTIWVDVLGNASPVFPYKYPALFSMPAAFLVSFLVSGTRLR
ncbi:MAG TPA: cation acetate symporter [Vicinamibacteria bacterium]|nr:cation acetate symporter [Vicinamibacteria bacterium]